MQTPTSLGVITGGFAYNNVLCTTKVFAVGRGVCMGCADARVRRATPRACVIRGGSNISNPV